MPSPDAFYAVPSCIFPIDRNQCLALDRRDGTVRQVDALAARALGCCHGVRSLEAHTAAMLQAGVSADPATIAGAVERLLALELLRPWTFTAPASATPSSAAEIDTVAVITADRPRVLARCLESIIWQCRRWSHAPRLLVVDGSRLEPAATVEVVCAAAKRAPGLVEYIGQSQAARIRHELAIEGVPQDVLDFALTPGEIGANRNLALLSTAGERILMVDDDVVLEPWALDDVDDGIALVGHEEPREWRFFASRQEALAAARRAEVDVLSAHAALLGQRLADVLAANEPRLEAACQHMLEAAAEPGDRRIRVSFSGLAGDSGCYCPRSLLFLAGTIRNVLLSNERALRLALSSREVGRVARRPCITHDLACMTYCTGVDNSSCLPPFVPIGRNEDGVFGAMLPLVADEPLLVHLPHGVIHDSTRPSAYSSAERMPSAVQTRVSDVVLALLAALPGFSRSTPVADRLRRTADCFADIAQLGPRQRAVIWSETLLMWRSKQVNRIGSAPTPGSPFGDALAEYRHTVSAAASRPDFRVPVDLPTLWAAAEGEVESAAVLIGRLSALLAEWPQMWAWQSKSAGASTLRVQ